MLSDSCELASPSSKSAGSGLESEAERAEILALLQTTLNTLCREDWVRLCMALKDSLGDVARPAWLAFSAAYAGEQKPGEAERVWDTAKPDGRAGPGTVHHLLHISGGGGHEANSFETDWPEPDRRLLEPSRPRPPEAPIEAVLSPRWAAWVRGAAEAKAAPPDYVLAALLVTCGALVGNSRWAAPWLGWSEPPILWATLIGSPSMNKSPGLDAVLGPLRTVERDLRERAKAELADWRAKAEVAKVAESAWKEAIRAALKDGEKPPTRPDSANPGPEPHLPRLAVADTTIEKLAVILAGQPRGTLLARDELAGWLQGMTRYSGGGSDRPFWLEAYGGRAYTVERMGREPVYVERLAVGVLGGIQPDRLRSLLIASDDEGLLARLMPIWPEPAPIRRPEAPHDPAFLEEAIRCLLTLRMHVDEAGQQRPWMVHLSNDAQHLLDALRLKARTWESEAEGLLLSFIGKLPGLAVRLSLVLALIDWASGEGEEPHAITDRHFARAAHLVEQYLLPMARRAYAEASVPKHDRAARRLVALIREEGWQQFTSREVTRKGRVGLATASELNPALAALEEAEIIREVGKPVPARTGRPPRLFLVNPAVHGGQR